MSEALEYETDTAHISAYVTENAEHRESILKNVGERYLRGELTDDEAANYYLWALESREQQTELETRVREREARAKRKWAAALGIEVEDGSGNNRSDNPASS